MAEFAGGEPISVGVDEPITFENKTDTAFDVSCGIVFRKSGLYRVSIDGSHTSVAVEPERKKGRWVRITQGAVPEKYMCPFCRRTIEDSGVENLLSVRFPFCHCGADMREGEQE